MPRLQLHVLGSPRLELDGAALMVDTRKAIALLVYLVMTGEAQTRDTLATLLWPEYAQESARAALRRTLSTLNKALGESFLEISREKVALKPGADLWSDVAQFHALLEKCHEPIDSSQETSPSCLQFLTQAVALYRGDFLTGFSLRDSSSFDDWQFFQTDSLRRELSAALEKLVQVYRQEQNYEAAIVHARRWLALDPLHEEAHRQLMICYARAGQRNAALRQYRECVRILEHELGVPPLEETTQLYEMIKEWREDAPADSPIKPVEQVAKVGSITRTPSLVPAPLTLQKILPAQLPLVGRRREWEYLLQTYQAMKQDSYILGLEGEAGIGKTRLAEEFLMHQQSLGVAILSGRCYEGESGLAYSPLIEALRKVLQTPEGANRLRSTPAHWLSETARLLPEIATNSAGPAIPPALEGSGAQGRFFEGLTQTIITVCGGTPPGICFLDDLQWTDSATLDLLAYLVRRFSKPPMLLLIAWRGEGNDADQRLRRIIAEASRAHKSSLLSLRRLEEVDVAELVSTAFRGEARPPDEWSQRLFQEAEGLPYFVVEFLAAYSTGPVETQTPDWSLPHSVRDLLRSRLASIDEKAGQLLTTAAVIGRSFDFDTLREASGRSEIETVTGLEALIERKLVQERAIGSEKPGMVYDFSHDKLRELVYTDSSLSRRRLLHRRVAEALVSQVRSTRLEAGGLTSQIAHHYRLSGNEPLAADYYKLAGDHARSVFANREALGHYQSALALGYADVPVLHESIGDLQTLLGDYSAALSSYETAAALSLPERLATLEHKIGDIHHRRGEWELAECHYQAALESLPGKGAQEQRARLYADWSLTAFQRGQIEQARSLAKNALELANAIQVSPALAQAYNVQGILARNLGDTVGALRHLTESLRVAEDLGDANALIAAFNNLALAHRDHGELEKAFQLTRKALELCIQLGDRHRQAALLNNLADLYHAAGQPEEAMAHLKKAVSIFTEIGVEMDQTSPEIWKLTEW